MELPASPVIGDRVPYTQYRVSGPVGQPYVHN